MNVRAPLAPEVAGDPSPVPGATVPGATVPGYADTAPRRPGTRRRVLSVIGWTVAVTLGGLLIALAAGRPAPDEYLHPDGTGTGGTRALVEVLRDRGIEVDVVGTSAAVVEVGGPGTTVVVGNSDLLTSASARQLVDGTAAVDRLVLLDGLPGVLRELDLGLRVERAYADPLAGCSAPWADDGDRLTRASWTVIPEDGTLPDGATACFPSQGPDEPEAEEQPAGFTVVDLPATATRAPLTVVGAPDAATNRFITEADDAGVMVRLLGGSPRLVWFHPTAEDLAANPATDDESVWPQWLGPVLVLLGAAFLVFAVARGRRLGRLVPEPLPVVVRAAETTESRAELYRVARDRERASAILRRATAARLTARLGLPPSAPPGTIVPAVADATGVPVHDVERILLGPAPTDDEGLVQLAQQLAHLEEKARRP